MKNHLSPATRAVLNAFAEAPINCRSGSRLALASALRALSNDWRQATELIDGIEYIRTSTLEDMATELEDK